MGLIFSHGNSNCTSKAIFQIDFIGIHCVRGQFDLMICSEFCEYYPSALDNNEKKDRNQAEPNQIEPLGYSKESCP